jgi:hypothetical protein
VKSIFVEEAWEVCEEPGSSRHRGRSIAGLAETRYAWELDQEQPGGESTATWPHSTKMYEGPDDVRRRGLAITRLWFAPGSLGLSSPNVTQCEPKRVYGISTNRV